jgi:hypothetical protein
MSENTSTRRTRKRANTENTTQQMVNENTMDSFVMIMPVGGESYGFPKPMPKDTTDVKAWLIANGYSERLMEILGKQFTYEVK